MAKKTARKPSTKKYLDFHGRLVMVGFGSIGQGVLPGAVHPLTRLVTDPQLDEYMANLRQIMARAVDGLPDQPPGGSGFGGQGVLGVRPVEFDLDLRLARRRLRTGGERECRGLELAGGGRDADLVDNGLRNGAGVEGIGAAVGDRVGGGAQAIAQSV